MTTRLLPIEEWARLAQTDLALVLQHVRPEDARVVVVEDGDRIVACWSALRMPHLEGLWIDPAYRGRVGVARRLWTATLGQLTDWAHGYALTGANSPEMAAMLERAGAQKVPMDTYVLPVEERCPQPS